MRPNLRDYDCTPYVPPAKNTMGVKFIITTCVFYIMALCFFYKLILLLTY